MTDDTDILRALKRLGSDVEKPVCPECRNIKGEGTIHTNQCRYNGGFPRCGRHLCSRCDRDVINGWFDNE